MNTQTKTLLMSLLLCASLAKAQPAPSFAVASIKPSSGAAGNVSFRLVPGGGVNIAGAPLRELIKFAYDIRDFQLSGGPGWVSSDGWDINAKPDGDAAPLTPADATPERMEAFQKLVRQRMQTLLAERFQLKLVEESKELPIYNLVEAKGGSKLKPSEATGGPSRRIQMGRGQFNASSASMKNLVMSLGNAVGRPVYDKTGLTGVYEMKLEWTPDSGPGGPAGPDGHASAPTDGSGASIFTALQEQLGLRLESAKGPVTTYRIGNIQKPSDN